MKIYVVIRRKFEYYNEATMTQYFDKEIDKIFTTREEAELHKLSLEMTGKYAYVNIDEHKVETIVRAK